MKQKLLLFISALICSFSAWAQSTLVDETNVVTVGSAVSSVEEGKWYVLCNAQDNVYPYTQGEGQAILVSNQNPTEKTVAEVAGYLVRFASVADNTYTIQSANGQYWGAMGVGTINAANADNAGQFVKGTASSRSNAYYFAQTAGESTVYLGYNKDTKELTGNESGSAPNSSRSTLAWKIYSVELEQVKDVTVTITATTISEDDVYSVSVKNADGTYTTIDNGATVTTGNTVRISAVGPENHEVAVTVDGTVVSLSSNGTYEFKLKDAVSIAITYSELEIKTLYARVLKSAVSGGYTYTNWSVLPYEEDKDYYTIKIKLFGNKKIQLIDWLNVGDENETITANYDPSTGYVTSFDEADDGWFTTSLDIDGYHGFYIYEDYSSVIQDETSGTLYISTYSYTETTNWPYIIVEWMMDDSYNPGEPGDEPAEGKEYAAKVVKEKTIDGYTYTNWSAVAYNEEGALDAKVTVSDGKVVVDDWTGSNDPLTVNFNPATGEVTSIEEAYNYQGQYWMDTNANIDNYGGCYVYPDYSTVYVDENGGYLAISCYSYENEANGYPYILVEWSNDVLTGITSVTKVVKATKIIKDGKVVIMSNGKLYNVAGSEL